ncbi:MAG: hypothetical protein ACFFCE_02030 [Promethearchaeota archaeon]
MAKTIYSRDKGIKIWPGPYREADPEWKNQFSQWIIEYLPEGTKLEIVNILQRDDSRGFKINLKIGNELNMFLTLNFQGDNPFKQDRSLFLITTSIPLPIKEYYPVMGNILDRYKGIPSYELYKSDRLIRKDDDPLIQGLMNAVDKKFLSHMFNAFGKKSIRINQSYTQQIGISNRFSTIEIKNYLRVFPSEELKTMIFEHDSFLILLMKKNKKKKIKKGGTSFYGLFKFAIENYNSISSKKAIIEENYKSSSWTM